MSEASGGGRWQCKHCHAEIVVPSGVVVKFCSECGKAPAAQEPDFEAVYCVNPNCRVKLFTPTQKLCHECGWIQLKEQQPQPPPSLDAQATSTSTTVHVTSSDVASASRPTVTTQAQHYEAVQKAVEANRNQRLTVSQSEDMFYDAPTTLPQHMGQGSAGGGQGHLHPTVSHAAMGPYDAPTTLTQRMPPTQHMGQGSAGGGQGHLHPTVSHAAMGPYDAPTTLTQHMPPTQHMGQGSGGGGQGHLHPTVSHAAMGPYDAPTTLTQHMPPTQHMGQGSAGGGQGHLHPAVPHAAMGPHSQYHVSATTVPPLPPRSQLVYQQPTQQPQKREHTQYPREFGVFQQGRPSSDHSQNPNSTFQGSQVLVTQSTGGPQPKILNSHPSPASPQVPPDKAQPLSNQPLPPTGTPKTTTATSTASTTYTSDPSLSNKGLSNEDHSQTHQFAKNAEEVESDDTHDKQKVSEKEEKDNVPVSKPQEAAGNSEKAQRNQNEGQGSDQDVKEAISNPLQTHSAGSQSTSTSPPSNKRKRTAENEEGMADASDPLSKQQKISSPNTGAKDTTEAQQGEGVKSLPDQLQKKDSQNPPNYADMARRSLDQVCPLISYTLHAC